MLSDLVKQCRTYRRFYEDAKITDEELKELVDLARLTASTANSQALKFMIINSPDKTEAVFPALGWAGALPDWDGPVEGERPAAYILICCDQSLAKNLSLIHI